MNIQPEYLNCAKLLYAEVVQYKSVVVVCAMVAVFGAFGGFVGGLYRRKCDIIPKPQNWRERFCFMLYGVVSAFAVMVMCKWLGLVFDNPDAYTRGLYIVGISVVSGCFSMRIIPCLASMIEDRLNQLTRDVQRNKDDIKEVSDDTEYNSVIMKVEAALLTGNSLDCYELVSAVEKLLPQYPLRRTINIFYGRLLRREGRYQEAIAALERYIGKVLEDRKALGLRAEDNSALAASYFNIACYYALQLSDDDEPREVLEQVRQNLLQSARYDGEVLNRWGADDDLAALHSRHPEFLRQGA